MQSLSGQQSRRVDQLAITEFGMSGLVLMENAGRGVADLLERLGLKRTSRIIICCGKGNNGGDGFVLARHLLIRNFQPTVLLFANPTELMGDALINYQILQSLKFLRGIKYETKYGQSVGAKKLQVAIEQLEQFKKLVFG
jgi:NAD(P)H-hydrate epimerase